MAENPATVKQQAIAQIVQQDYIFLKELGQGTYGTVFLCEKNGRKCAIKTIEKRLFSLS